MSLSLRQIRYVVEVARLGSIQAASRDLGISQSSILAAIDLAEAEIQAKMFTRRPSKGMHPTPAGERYIAAARSLLSAEAEFAREIGTMGDRPRSVRIGCFEPFGPLFMPEVLRRLVARTGPMDIALLEGDQAQLRVWLESGFVDAAVTYDIGSPFVGYITPICRMPAHILMRADDPLAEQEVVSLEDFVDRPMVLLDLPQTATYFSTIFEMTGRSRRIGFRTRSYETVRAAVGAGFGVALLNMRPSAGVMDDGPLLARRPLLEDLPPPTLIVVDPYGHRKPAFLREFIGEMRAYFHELGPNRFAVTTPERAHLLLVADD